MTSPESCSRHATDLVAAQPGSPISGRQVAVVAGSAVEGLPGVSVATLSAGCGSPSANAVGAVCGGARLGTTAMEEPRVNRTGFCSGRTSWGGFPPEEGSGGEAGALCPGSLRGAIGGTDPTECPDPECPGPGLVGGQEGLAPAGGGADEVAAEFGGVAAGEAADLTLADTTNGPVPERSLSALSTRASAVTGVGWEAAGASPPSSVEPSPDGPHGREQLGEGTGPPGLGPLLGHLEAPAPVHARFWNRRILSLLMFFLHSVPFCLLSVCSP